MNRQESYRAHSKFSFREDGPLGSPRVLGMSTTRRAISSGVRPWAETHVNDGLLSASLHADPPEDVQTRPDRP